MKPFNPESLPEIANQALGGLNAGQEMKMRIRAKAQSRQRTRVMVRRAACAAAAVVIVAGAAVYFGANRPAAQQPLITSIAAGSPTVQPGEETMLSMGGSGLSISKASNQYRSLWAGSSDGAFPMIGVKGRYYRMMTTPDAVPASLLGQSLGAVTEFTTEPALSASDTLIMSNQAASGTQVYEIKGMSGTLVAAEVNGSMRLFQRVSFNGTARRKGESLADTLQLAGHIRMMELGGVGVISDSAVCDQLFRTLTSKASYESSGSLSAQQSLLIELDNGLTVQLLVKNDKLAACGVWSCPEFIAAFEQAVR